MRYGLNAIGIMYSLCAGRGYGRGLKGGGSAPRRPEDAAAHPALNGRFSAAEWEVAARFEAGRDGTTRW